MLSRNKISLNVISQEAAVKLIHDTISKGINVRYIFVDTVGPADKYQKYLSSLFPGINITVESKADSKFPCVSAASIVAKVNRDRIIADWEFKEKVNFSREFGCGYPSDPITKKWLRKTIDPVFGFPNMVRFSWKTTKDLIDERGKECFWENYVEEDEKKSKPRPKVDQIFTLKGNNFWDNNDINLNFKLFN
jgi:ribonuclease H2 subunit A